jgi:MFS family permease
VVGGLGAIAGPVVGGLLVGYLPVSTAIQLTAVWSFFMVGMLFYSGLDSPITDDETKISNFITQLRTSYRPIMQIRKIRFLFITFFAIVFATTFSDVIFVFFTTIDLKGGPLLVGLLVAAWSIGLTLGAWYLGKETDGERIVRFAYYGAIGMGVSLFGCGLSAQLFDVMTATAAIAALFIVGGFSNGVHNVAVRTSIFKFVPKGQHGRAYSLYSLITRVAAVLGYFAGGLVGKQASILVYWISGSLAILFGMIGLIILNSYIQRPEIVKTKRVITDEL